MRARQALSPPIFLAGFFFAVQVASIFARDSNVGNLALPYSMGCTRFLLAWLATGSAMNVAASSRRGLI